MGLIKNIFKYIIVILAVVFMAVALLAGIMFLFDVQLFGVRYIENKDETAVLLTTTNVSKITVETGNYDVLIVPNSEPDQANNNRMRIVIDNNMNGFSTDGSTTTLLEKVNNIGEEQYLDVSNFKNDTFNHFVTETANGVEYTFKFKEPSGLIFFNDSKISIHLPENLEGVEYNIKTKKGNISFAKNSVNSSKSVSTADVTIDVSSAQGSMKLDNLKMKDGSTLNIANYIGRVEINNNNIGNVIIDSNQGNFAFKNIGYTGFNGGNLTVTGNNPYVRADVIFGAVNFNTTTGYLKAEQILGDVIVETENGIVKVNKIEGIVAIDNKYGEVSINQVGGEDLPVKSVVIESKSGAINLGQREVVSTNTYEGVYYLNSILVESSKVVIDNMHATTSSATPRIETTKGSVRVTFAKTDVEKNLEVETRSGEIVLNNIYGNVSAKTSKSSRIIANFYKISALTTFETDNGDIDISLPAATNSADKQYNLNFKNKSNLLNVVLGSFIKNEFEGGKDGNGYYNFNQTFPNDVTTTNTISVKTNSGNIVVKEIID